LIKFRFNLIKNHYFSIALVAFFLFNISTFAEEYSSSVRNIVLDPIDIKENLEIEKPRSYERFILASNTEKILDFRLAFVVLSEPEGLNRDIRVINVADELKNPRRKEITVDEGDKVSLYVEPNENTYVYIFLLNSSNELNLLFPTNLDEETIKNEFYSGKGTYIPGKFKWFTFDENKGIEKFYLIALSEREEELEKLTRIYLSSDSDKEVAKQNVQNRIKEIKRSFAFANMPDWPVSYAGTIADGRGGVRMDIAEFAIGINTNTFYTRTIQFDHE